MAHSEKEFLLPLKHLNRIQQCKNTILNDTDHYVSLKTRKYKKLTVFWASIVVFCAIGIIVTITILAPRIHISHDLLFANYNATLTDLLKRKENNTRDFDDVYHSIMTTFASVLNNATWIRLGCSVICSCHYNFGNDLYSLCKVVIDFRGIIRDWHYYNPDNPFAWSLSGCRYSGWFRTYEDYGLCLNFYDQGRATQEQKGNTIVRKMWDSYITLQDDLYSVEAQIKDTQNIINSGFSGIDTDYTSLIILLPIVIGLITVILTVLVVWYALVYRHYSYNVMQSNMTIAECIQETNTYKNIKSLMSIQKENVGLYRTTYVIRSLSDREDSIRLRWLQILAFLGGILRPEASSHTFLKMCGWGVRRMILSLSFPKET